MQAISDAILSQFRWFGRENISHADPFRSSLILSRVRSNGQLKQLLLCTTLGLGFGVVTERVALSRSELPGVSAH